MIKQYGRTNEDDDDASGFNPSGDGSRPWNLPSLIDFALRNNPHTRRAWEAARAAAANFGAAQAPYYPHIALETDSGYQRTMIELPSAAGTLKQWQMDPVAELNWTLLDLGRRRSASEIAHSQLIATSFSFNREIQDVVFGTETAFYALDAANSAVLAAKQNLQLAETDLEAVKQRVKFGLATEPEHLMARERVAQSRFDLANAKLLVHDREAPIVPLGVVSRGLHTRLWKRTKSKGGSGSFVGEGCAQR